MLWTKKDFENTEKSYEFLETRMETMNEDQRSLILGILKVSGNELLSMNMKENIEVLRGVAIFVKDKEKAYKDFLCFVEHTFNLEQILCAKAIIELLIISCKYLTIEEQEEVLLVLAESGDIAEYGINRP